MVAEVTEFQIILEANCKPARTKRKKIHDPVELTQLMKVREVWRCIQQGKQCLVVTDSVKTFDEVFDNKAEALRTYGSDSLVIIKTLDKVTAEDLELPIFEFH